MKDDEVIWPKKYQNKSILKESEEIIYRRLLLGDFLPDNRQIALHDRLREYYKSTPESMDNKAALPYWLDFKRWCAERGYNQEEINKAKREIGPD